YEFKGVLAITIAARAESINKMPPDDSILKNFVINVSGVFPIPVPISSTCTDTIQ
ncbi:MAG: hypothetical protein GY699_25720, partial [Desulfobacteraceae bacterium]|nr:hypothetical protein [Desulfobacteraceae bacterium]